MNKIINRKNTLVILLTRITYYYTNIYLYDINLFKGVSNEQK